MQLVLRVKKRDISIYVLLCLMIFQNGLEFVWNGFSYLDELVPIIGFMLLLHRNKVLDSRIFIGILAYSIVGLMGDVLYQYQQAYLVAIDLFTNIKFFLNIFFGEIIFARFSNDELEHILIPTSKTITNVFTALVIADLVFNIWPGQVRYGIKSISLFYSHPTYFAGALSFLIICFTLYFKQNYLKYIVVDLVMLALTLRTKAIAFAALYIIFFLFIIKPRKRIKLWHILLAAMFLAIVGYSQYSFYFVQLRGRSARSVMLITSLRIMKDYFPIGTGFGTYGSHVASAAVRYSPVYSLYGFGNIHELRNSMEGTFFDDQFWPIVFGQTGILGTIIYFYLITCIVINVIKIRKFDKYFYYGGILSLAFLLLSSIAEPAFNNSVALGPSLIIGFVYSRCLVNRIAISNFNLETNTSNNKKYY